MKPKLGLRDITLLIECLTIMHKALGLSPALYKTMYGTRESAQLIKHLPVKLKNQS